MPQRGVTGFEKVFGTPHNQDLAKVVAGFGISHDVVTNPKELHIALQRIHPNIHVIIAKMPDRESNADFLRKAFENFQINVVS